MELDELISRYKAVRLEREAIEAQYKNQIAELAKAIETKLAESGLKSAKTESGQAIPRLGQPRAIPASRKKAMPLDLNPRVLPCSTVARLSPESPLWRDLKQLRAKWLPGSWQTPARATACQASHHTGPWRTLRQAFLTAAPAY